MARKARLGLKPDAREQSDHCRDQSARLFRAKFATGAASRVSAVPPTAKPRNRERGKVRVLSEAQT